MQGYFHSALDTMRADSIWKVTLKKGPRILPDSITWVIPNKVQTIFGDIQITNQRELNDWSKLEQYIESALIIGENEVNERRYALKNLTSGEQESLTVADIIAKLNRN